MAGYRQAYTETDLAAVVDKLPQRDRNFADSLLSQWKQSGSLSSKQMHWVDVLCQRAKDPQSQAGRPQVKTAEVGDMAGIIAMFDRAAAAIKHPAIVLEAEGRRAFRLTVAGPTSRAPGSLNVTDLGSFESRTWYGRITRQGVFEQSRKVEELPAGLVELLKRFAADPAGVASEYGKSTGACCFCARELTDERSVSVGYGPICADRYGLPWGGK